MAREFEVVSHKRSRFLNLFLVRLSQRTMHIHRDFELGLVLRGEMQVQLEQRKARLSANDAFVINPMEAHAFSSQGEGALLLAIQLSPRLLETLIADFRGFRFDNARPVRARFAEAGREYELFRAVCLELAYQYLRHRPGYELPCMSLAGILLHTLRSAVPWELQTDKQRQALQLRMQRMSRITEAIDQGFQRKLLLRELAEQEGLSLSYLSGFFKDTLGVTFQEYVNRRRFEYACELIETTGRSILDISVESGFSDVRYLNRRFAEEYGCSPKEYRQSRAARPTAADAAAGAAQFIYPAEDSLLLIGQLRSEQRERMGEVPFEKVFE